MRPNSNIILSTKLSKSGIYFKNCVFDLKTMDLVKVKLSVSGKSPLAKGKVILS
jgi:hypothetical protein